MINTLRLERVTGIEPAFSAWEADVLPLNYTRLVRGDPSKQLDFVLSENISADLLGEVATRTWLSRADLARSSAPWGLYWTGLGRP